jgi:hypothetical protein
MASAFIQTLFLFATAKLQNLKLCLNMYNLCIKFGQIYAGVLHLPCAFIWCNDDRDDDSKGVGKIIMSVLVSSMRYSTV